ncbi:MAG: hypothetical protein ACJAYU_001284 [Bradymonadia bacterium]|jgi:hypothetical protein
MGHEHDEDHDSKEVKLPKVTPVDYEKTRMSVRARPQWDPKELGNKMLDDMEKGGRLHLTNKRK